MRRLNLPFDLQRRADIVKALLKQLREEIQRRIEINFQELTEVSKYLDNLIQKEQQREEHERLVKEFIWITISKISLTVQIVQIELQKRINSKLSQELLDVQNAEHKQYRLRLSSQVKEFLDHFLKVAPEIEKLLDVGKDVFGFDDDDKKRFKEMVDYVKRLYNYKYV